MSVDGFRRAVLDKTSPARMTESEREREWREGGEERMKMKRARKRRKRGHLMTLVPFR